MDPTTDLRGRLKSFSAVAALVIVFFVGYAVGNDHLIGRAQGNTTPPPGAQEAFAPFWQVYNLIQDQYIDDVPVDQLVAGATKGMVDSLGDPYSGYMDAQAFGMLNSDLEGEFDGIGVVIHTIESSGAIEVVGLLDGAPAQGVGIRPGDIFAKVNDVDVSTLNQTDLAILVRGPEGTDVKITMKRGDELIDFTITRARITVPNVESRVLDDNIAYIKLNQFSSKARADLDSALEQVDVNDRAGLIFDLRDNPGGLLSSAVSVGSAFIQSGPITIESYGDGSEQVYSADGSFANIRVPIVVLVNEASASASELIAGALQDTHTATIMGEVTLGKGTVQQWLPLENQGGLRLTIARWLTPDRRWIHQEGITPDIVVDWTPTTFNDPNDPQLLAAEDFLLERSGVAQP